MTPSKLASEIRQQTRRFVDGKISLDEFRVAFYEADRLANYGRLSGLADGRLVGMTDEMQAALSDFDDGFIDFDQLKHELMMIEAAPREGLRVGSQDKAAMHH